MSKELGIQPTSDEEQILTGLLNPEERLVCKQISAGIAPWSQRAQALLAVDEGATNQAAAETAGLRTTQVKYWIDAFHRQRTDIFPESILKGVELTSDSSESEHPEENTPSAESSSKGKKSEKPKKKKKSKTSKGKKGKASTNKKRKGRKKKGRGKNKSN